MIKTTLFFLIIRMNSILYPDDIKIKYFDNIANIHAMMDDK